MGRSEYAKKKREELKQFIEDYKRTSPCVRCGCTDHRVLEFHHKNPSEKRFSIFHAIHNRYSIKSVSEEILKTVVVCANCHRIIHHEWDNEELHSEVWG